MLLFLYKKKKMKKKEGDNNFKYSKCKGGNTNQYFI